MDTPWRTVRWMPMTAETLAIAPDGSDSDSDWTYDFKPAEAELHELRKRIQLYEPSLHEAKEPLPKDPSGKDPSGKDPSGKDPSGEKTGISTWEYYKKVVNPYELVYTQKKYEEFPDSVCIYHPLSRSYFKILEVLAITDFFKGFKPSQKLFSAHVCEGPGGFIQGFLEECTRRRLTVGASTAITLRPKQQNVPGWKRATHFLQKHKQVRVVYGADGTGDLLSYANQDDFIRSTGSKVHFFTADGGFDFSTDYDSQEKTIFPLLVASVRTGFEVLAPGGLFVLKFFDLYYDGTKDLICFLSKHFRRWTLYKPATSRPCNPELYFIGDRFIPPTPPVLATLRAWSLTACAPEVDNKKVVPRRLLVDTPPLFVTLETFLRESVLLQTEYLRKVFDLIDASGKKEQIRALLKKHEVTSYDWCKAFSVCVYPQRIRLIEASRKYLQETGQLG